MVRDKVLERLETLLDRERRLLMCGDFGRLAALADRKEALVAALGEAGPDGPSLEGVKTSMRRNETMILAAQDGLRAVRTRLDELRTGAPLETYGADGAKAGFARPLRTLQRRA